MVEIRTLDRRREPRTEVNIALTVWGIDNKGERFLQEARARDISLSGALLSGLDTDLQSGDVIGILYAGRKARFRVVWIRYDGAGDKMQVAVHRLITDECPWKDLLAPEHRAPTTVPAGVRAHSALSSAFTTQHHSRTDESNCESPPNLE